MRRKWVLRFDLGDVLLFGWTAWMTVGMATTIVVSAITDHGDIGNVPSIVAASLWGFGGVVVPLIGFSIWGLRSLWRDPPIRRVKVSSPDLRTIYRQGDPHADRLHD